MKQPARMIDRVIVTSPLDIINKASDWIIDYRLHPFPAETLNARTHYSIWDSGGIYLSEDKRRNSSNPKDARRQMSDVIKTTSLSVTQLRCFASGRFQRERSSLSFSITFIFWGSPNPSMHLALSQAKLNKVWAHDVFLNLCSSFAGLVAPSTS